MITLTETTLIAAPIDRCFDLARSIEVHLAGNIHCGEQAATIAVGPAGSSAARTGLAGLGDTVTWQARHLLLRRQLTTRITAFNPWRSFQETMVDGVFRSLQHDHHFQAILSDGSGSLTAMHDVLRFSAPIPLLGRVAEALVLRRYMKMLVRQRNAVIKAVAESPNEAWQSYLSPAAAKTV
jgi:ligand-binding SRPBCC domain-containing protein